MWPVFGNDSDDDPTQLLQHPQPRNVLDVLLPILAVMVAVVLDSDPVLRPPHVQERDRPGFVEDGDLRLRTGKSAVQQPQSEHALPRRRRSPVDERKQLAQLLDTTGMRVPIGEIEHVSDVVVLIPHQRVQSRQRIEPVEVAP